MNKNYIFILILITFFACKKDTSPITLILSGIAETDEFNLILNDDPDDWQPRCVSGLSGNYCMLPAFPNPTDSVITFLFYLNHSAEVSVNIFDKPNHQITSIDASDYPTGLSKLQWSAKDDFGNELENGIYRAYFLFKSNEIEYESYGDILINRFN